MENQFLFNVFSEKCEQEKSTENLLFLEHVAKYKKIKDEKQRLAKGKFIQDEFLNTGSKLEVNVSRDIALVVVNSILNRDAPLDLFDNLEKEIELLVNDTMMRHTNTITKKSQENHELSELATTIVDDTYYESKSREIRGRSLDTRKKSDMQKLEEALQKENIRKQAEKRSKFIFDLKKIRSVSIVNMFK
jgi:hypothetical protein